jgi:hypothetical protein
MSASTPPGDVHDYPIRFMSAVLVKDVLETHFPGGLAGFRTAYPGLPEEEHLVRFCAMSWDDLGASLDVLRALGVPIEGHYAVADMFAGPYVRCERIAIESNDGEPMPQWVARFIA